MLRVLRIFRLLRVFRFGLRLGHRMGWLNVPLQQRSIAYFYVLVTVVAVVLFGAIGLSTAESGSEAFESLDNTTWWSIMTLVSGEPIGEIPQTTFGRLTSLTVMLTGLVLFATLTGFLSAVMIHRFNKLDTRTMDLDELYEHIVICGWSRSGELLVEEFQGDSETRNRPLVIIAEFEEDAIRWSQHVRAPELIYTVRGDFTRLEVLERAGVRRASHAIVLADQTKERSEQDRDARTVLTALLIERLNKEIFTSVELMNRDNESFLKMVGVEEVVVAGEYAAFVIAAATKNKGIVPLLDEVLTARFGNQFYKVLVPERLVGERYADIAYQLKSESDVTLIGVEEKASETSEEAAVSTGKMRVNPKADRVVKAGENLLIIARERPKL